VSGALVVGVLWFDGVVAPPVGVVDDVPVDRPGAA
jgi:hypothetical protein